jgi:hypothetical protein
VYVTTYVTEFFFGDTINNTLSSRKLQSIVCAQQKKRREKRRAREESMSRFADPLVVGRVIGEVVDLFVPSISMTVAYGPKDISNGVLLKPSATAAPPLVRISGRRNDLYTLVILNGAHISVIFSPVLCLAICMHMLQIENNSNLLQSVSSVICTVYGCLCMYRS